NRNPEETPNHGRTFVLIIHETNDGYSISDKELPFPIKCGGIVKLFSKKDKQRENSSQNADKNSSQNADGHLLILLAFSGIYKYHIDMKNKSINIQKLQKLKYPRRIYNTIISNINTLVEIDGGDEDEKCLMTYSYIERCINKHYFLVDTMEEDIKYIELYDLKTNQLVNTFQRQAIDILTILDFTTYAISNNAKLLAYVSLATQGIKIYSIECGIEIAECSLKLGESQKELDGEILALSTFIHFFHNDEMLLVYTGGGLSAVWNIFDSLRNSIELKKLLKTPVAALYEGYYYVIERSNSFMVIGESDKLAIYDDSIIDEYSKKTIEQNWRLQSGKDFENLLGQESRHDHILNLHFKKPKFEKLDEYYHTLEPWLGDLDLDEPRYSFYLDEEKKKLLLVGTSSVQVWYDQGSERSLEFIYVPLFYLHSDEEEKWKRKKIKIVNIEYCTGKFKLKIQIGEMESAIKIKMEDEDDLMNVAKYACYTLKYFSFYREPKRFKTLLWDKLKFTDIIERTRRIILRFIRLYPNAWRLLDVRFDLMTVLIEAKEYELVNDILSFGEPIHIPKYYSWSGEKNAIETAFSDLNIGLMNTVVDIIPKLYGSNEKMNGKEKGENDKMNEKEKDENDKMNEKEKDENDKMNEKEKEENEKKHEKEKDQKKNVKEKELREYYARKLFYSSCFCSTKCELSSFEFLEISPKSSGLLKIFIPITQLIPQDSKLDLKKIGYDKIDDIKMYLILSSKYKGEKHNHSPFIELIKFMKKDEHDILYENPSMGVVMNWM
ncbi:24747_t:CDS:2, partial [Racocetra persica]